MYALFIVSDADLTTRAHTLKREVSRILSRQFPKDAEVKPSIVGAGLMPPLEEDKPFRGIFIQFIPDSVEEQEKYELVYEQICEEIWKAGGAEDVAIRVRLI